MSGYDCRNKCVFSFWRNVVSDGADWTSAGRLVQSRGQQQNIEETGGRRSQPASTSRRQISDVLQPVRQVLRCSAVKSSADSDRQFELDALGCPQPVKTGESICNMLRATKTSDRPSCRVEDRLETVNPLKGSGIRWLHFKVFSAIQI